MFTYVDDKIYSFDLKTFAIALSVLYKLVFCTVDQFITMTTSGSRATPPPNGRVPMIFYAQNNNFSLFFFRSLRSQKHDLDFSCQPFQWFSTPLEKVHTPFPPLRSNPGSATNDVVSWCIVFCRNKLRRSWQIWKSKQRDTANSRPYIVIPFKKNNDRWHDKIKFKH